MKVLISAAEISSDQHAAIVARALTELRSGIKESVQFFGIGGPALRALPNFRCVIQAEGLRAMGITEVLKKMSVFREALDTMVGLVASEKPDLILTLDYPDFHFRLLERVHEMNLVPQATKICGIPPKVWVWRSNRVEKIRKFYDGVWAIFPFEKTFYQARGIPVIEEGNPLLWKMMQQKPEKIIDPDRELIAVMPGSRDSEWAHLLPIIPSTLEQLAHRIQRDVRALVPVPEGLHLEQLKIFLRSSKHVQYQFLPCGSVQALSSARVGLIKSGTSTLEAVMLGCVPVIFYRMNYLTEKFFEHIMRYKGPVGLPNILLGIKDRARSVFPEFLGREATPKSLSIALQKSLNHSQSVEQAIKSVQSLMHAEGQVSARIADQMLQWCQVKPTKMPAPESKISFWMASQLWSVINLLRRRLYHSGLLRSKPIPIPSVLVGNLQAGGSGKTPLLIELAKEALSRRLRVAVVSRGYGIKTQQKLRVAFPGEVDLHVEDYGDEPIEIKTAVPEIYLGVGANRFQVVQSLMQRSSDRGDKIDLVLFDDGFQNLKFKPTIAILLKTAHNRSQTVYRDFDSQGRYADYVFENPGPQLDWEPEFLPAQAIWIVCGIANPLRIRNFYESRGVKVDRVIAFPDHHHYSESEVKKLMSEAKSKNIKIFITEKDAVKWRSFKLDEPVGVLKIKLRNRDWMDEVFDRIACIPSKTS